MLEPLALTIIPYDATGAPMSSEVVAISRSAVTSVRPIGANCLVDVAGVGFVVAGSLAAVSQQIGGNLILVTVTLPGDDVTQVQVALSVDHISHIVPFDDSGCQIRCAGVTWRCVLGRDIVVRAMHEVLRLYSQERD
jgi:hypothetical protein